MRDAALVRGADRVRERNRQRQQPVQRQAALGDDISQRSPVDQFQRQEGDAVDLLNRVDRDDVGMIELGGGARLALEALPAVGVAGQFAGQHLQRDAPLELGVFGEVHLAHAALAEQFEDPVVTERAANHAWGNSLGTPDSTPASSSRSVVVGGLQPAGALRYPPNLGLTMLLKSEPKL